MKTHRFAPLSVWLLAASTAFVSGCVVIPVGDLLRAPALKEQVLAQGGGIFFKEKIAIITIRGEIRGGESGSSFFASPNTVEETRARLNRVRGDEQVKAVVVRIASPGGEVTACDEIYNELLKFKQGTGVPIVASIGPQGASGGYYVANAADLIYANPTAIVGSIGVLLQHFDASALLEKVGVRVGPIKSGDKKDLNSFWRGQTDQERAILQALVDDMHARFVDVVDAGRPALSRDAVLAVADGRVVSGEEARELGLVDAVGYLDDALEAARERAGVSSPTYVRYARAGGAGANIYSRSDVGIDSPDLELRLRGVRTGAPRLSYLWQP